MGSVSSCLAELQAAVYTALSAELVRAYVNVYDGTAPGTAKYPYVVIGEWTEAQADIHTRRGREATVLIHVWSGLTSMLPTNTIVGLVTDALDRQKLSMSNWDMLTALIELNESMMDSDELRHGLVRYRFRLARKR